MTSKRPRRLEVRSDLRFEIYGPNYIYYHVCLDCFDLLLNFDLQRITRLISARVAGASLPQLKINPRAQSNEHWQCSTLCKCQRKDNKVAYHYDGSTQKIRFD